MDIPMDLLCQGLEINILYKDRATIQLIEDAKICLREGLSHDQTVLYTLSLHPTVNLFVRKAAAKIAQEEIWVSEAIDLVKSEKDLACRGETLALLDEVCGSQNANRVLMKAKAVLLWRKMR